MKLRRSQYLKVGVGIIGIFLVYVIALSSIDFISPYKYVSEVLENPEEYSSREVQIAALIVNNTYSRNNGISTFVITDGNDTLNVTYEGNLPASFREDVSIVVIGKLVSEDKFKATTLLAKCPSKYEDTIVNTLEQNNSKQN